MLPIMRLVVGAGIGYRFSCLLRRFPRDRGAAEADNQSRDLRDALFGFGRAGALGDQRHPVSGRPVKRIAAEVEASVSVGGEMRDRGWQVRGGARVSGARSQPVWGCGGGRWCCGSSHRQLQRGAGVAAVRHEIVTCVD